MNYQTLLKQAQNRLESCQIENAFFDALQLLNATVGKDLKYPLYLMSQVTEHEEEHYRQLIERRCSHEPLQYILGEWDFYGATFKVGPGVLIPRPETEELTDMCALIIKAKSAVHVYDLCAGTGCIGISLARVCEHIHVWCFEKYDEAFAYLVGNIPENLKNRVHVVKCDVLQGCPSDIPTPDFIVSNPPYVHPDEMSGLQRELSFEPANALVGGDDGYLFYRAIAEKWLPLLQNGGMCAVELGETQAQTVKSLFNSYGTAFVREDFNGFERFVFLDKK